MTPEMEQLARDIAAENIARGIVTVEDAVDVLRGIQPRPLDYDSLTEALLAVMRSRHPDLVWSVDSGGAAPSEPNAILNGGATIR